MIKCASELEVETIAINFDPVVVIPFDVVWECLGFKDYFDFVETGED